MELFVVNKQLEIIDILDSFESLIWSVNFCGVGDCEIYAPASEYLLTLLQPDFYLSMKDSEHSMIIDRIELSYDADKKSHLSVMGSSLESILKRRIIWPQTLLTGNLQNGIKKLIDDSIINPTIPERKINNFVFEVSTDPNITSLTVDTQFTGTTVYDAIVGLCNTNNIGFSITISDNNNFVFKLKAGVNRSYDQLTNPYVVFSPNFENLVSSTYKFNKTKYANVALVAGEGEGTNRISTIVGNAVGINRAEIYTDARDLTHNVGDTTLTDAQYLAQLADRGVKDIAESMEIISFEGQADVSKSFKYGKDFFLGDIVQLASEYGLEGKTRVSEIIYTQNLSEISVYPTFIKVD